MRVDSWWIVRPHRHAGENLRPAFAQEAGLACGARLPKECEGNRIPVKFGPIWQLIDISHNHRTLCGNYSCYSQHWGQCAAYCAGNRCLIRRMGLFWGGQVPIRPSRWYLHSFHSVIYRFSTIPQARPAVRSVSCYVGNEYTRAHAWPADLPPANQPAT